MDGVNVAESIMRGLEEALSYVQGNNTKGRELVNTSELLVENTTIARDVTTYQDPHSI